MVTVDNQDPASCWEANAETWTRQVRAGYDIYRDGLNTPAFLAMLPDVAGKHGLDIGCGEGANTRAVARLGAKMDAVDIAPTFIRYAREFEREEPLGITYQVADACRLPFPDRSFDFATSFMCLMDVGDPQQALAEISRVLRPGGFLQFSILHPCFAPPHRRVLRNESGAVYAVEVADYFKTGRHLERWWFSATPEAEREMVEPFLVPFVHLTLSGWVECMHSAGLRLNRLGEPTASEQIAKEIPELADTRIAPLFLHIQACSEGV